MGALKSTLKLGENNSMCGNTRVCTGAFDGWDDPPKKRDEQVCSVSDQLIPGFSCCVVNSANFACPPGLDCTDKGCCEKDDPATCYVHVDIADATDALEA